MTDVGNLYRRSRRRLTDLLADLDDGAWQAPVAACPGWTVHDVIAHLVGVGEDVLAGRLTDIPDDTQTAGQVERHRGEPPAELLRRWADVAEPFEQRVTAASVWPAAFDVCSHEHDVRTAVSRPGARDDELVVTAAHRLIRGLDVDATITFDLGGETVQSPARPAPAPEYRVRTTPFEVFRLRLGRRSRSQVAALDWSPDPGDLIDQLFVFGPAREPLVE